MKTCSKCGIEKPLDEFVNDKNRKDGKCSQCKECRKQYKEEHKEETAEYQKEYREEHREEKNESSRDYYHNRGGREQAGHQSMYENKSCASYLGIVVAERLIKHLFNDVVMMPPGFPYDMVCNKGKRIDVKASTIRVTQNKNSTTNYWSFYINRNKIPDFFLCMAFDNVIDCNPLIAWMIPGKEFNNQSSAQISSSTIHKWDKWKMDLENAQQCCDLMKTKGD